MRAKLRKLVWKQVKHGIAARFPGFTLFVDRADGLFWRMEVSSELFFYIKINNIEKKDQFSIELNWNIVDEICLGISFFDPQCFNKDRGNLRIQLFLRDRKITNEFDLDPEFTQWINQYRKENEYSKDVDFFGETGLWPTENNTNINVVIERAPAIVEQALDMLAEHGIPYFRQLAEAHGVTNLDL